MLYLVSAGNVKTTFMEKGKEQKSKKFLTGYKLKYVRYTLYLDEFLHMLEKIETDWGQNH